MDESDLPPRRSTRIRKAPRAADASPPPLARKRRAEDDAREITNSWVVAASRSDLSKFVVSDLKKYCDKQEGICIILSDDRKTPIKADYINAICAYVDGLLSSQRHTTKRINRADEIAQVPTAKRSRLTVDIHTATPATLLSKLCVIQDLTAFCIENNIDYSRLKKKPELVQAITNWRDMSRDDGEVTDPTLKCASASKRVNFKGISVDFLNQYCSENDITSPTRFRKDLEDSIIRANGYVLAERPKARTVTTPRPATMVEVRLFRYFNDDRHIMSSPIALEADGGLNLATVARAFGVAVCEINYPGTSWCWHREVGQDVISKDQLTMLVNEGQYRVIAKTQKRMVK